MRDLEQVADILGREMLSFREAADQSGVSLSTIRQYQRQGVLKGASIVTVQIGRERFLFRSQLPKLSKLRDSGIIRRVAAAKAACAQ